MRIQDRQTHTHTTSETSHPVSVTLVHHPSLLHSVYRSLCVCVFYGSFFFFFWKVILTSRSLWHTKHCQNAQQTLCLCVYHCVCLCLFASVCVHRRARVCVFAFKLYSASVCVCVSVFTVCSWHWADNSPIRNINTPWTHRDTHTLTAQMPLVSKCVCVYVCVFPLVIPDWSKSIKSLRPKRFIG